MPCMKCDALIPNGTAIRLANGLMCSDCLPDSTLDFLRNNVHTMISNWHYYKEIDDSSSNFRYIMTEKVTQEDYRRLRGIYYLYPLQQEEIIDASDMDRVEYLILNGGCKVYSTHLHNCTIIARGNLEMYNSTVYSFYVCQHRNSSLLLDNSAISYIRGISGSDYPTINLTLNNAPMPDDCSEIYLSQLIARNITIPLSVHNSASPFDLIIEDSTIPQLHVCDNIATLSLINSTVSDFDNEDYSTSTLCMTNSSITLIEGSRINTKIPINSSIITIPSLLCPMCNQPIRRGETILVKGNSVHQKCMRRGSYSFRDFTTIGESTKLPPFGFELELHYTSYSEPQSYIDALYDLIVHGFTRCSDSTVSDEMKSPILRSDKWILDIAPTLDMLAKEYIDDRCGTHIHVSSNSSVLTFLNRRCGIFEAMSEHMHEHEDETIRIWGRYFNDHYANYDVNGGRTSWINVSGTHHQTIEYRLPQLKNVEQYRRLVYFCRLFTLKLHKIHEDYATRRGMFYTSKMERTILEYYKKFETLALKGEK